MKDPQAVGNASAGVGAVGRVGGLFVHPIKSTAPIAVDELWLDELGAVGDRRWMLIDRAGDAITARTHPALALVQTRFSAAQHGAHAARNMDGPLWVSSVGAEDLTLALPVTAKTRTGIVWSDAVDVQDAGDEAASWFSEVIQSHCRLVRLAAAAQRPLQQKYAGPLSHAGRRVALSDGAPLLLLSQASVEALNARIASAYPELANAPMVVRRFRPNVLIVEAAAHAEDAWSRIRIGDVAIGVGSACLRCVLTTVDPDTGARGHEPLRTLATYRRHEGHVLFAMNATHAAPGVIRLGDHVRETIPSDV